MQTCDTCHYLVKTMPLWPQESLQPSWTLRAKQPLTTAEYPLCDILLPITLRHDP